ncbi:MAG: DUF429 domain-containing protein [Anaerolineae bacterium]|nr:DUF429 domain-containing protein [Anaerolineae bacterium]
MTGNTVYIGIDPTAGVRAITCAVLDNQLRILHLDSEPLESVVEVVLSYPDAVCGIDAPISKNKGLLADPEYRRSVGLLPGRSTYSTYRVCEYELRRRGIYLYNTPPDEERIPQWMETGWELYDRLFESGYVTYPERGQQRLFETYPHAVFTVLLKRLPYSKNRLEGLLQRQLVLYQAGIDVEDPMLFMEEWTEYRLLTGKLNFDAVIGHDELDALVAAYTACCIDQQPGDVLTIGDPVDGQIVLPTGELKETYRE